MKIGIDGSSVTPNKAGTGYYAFSMIKALEQIDSKNEYYIFTNESKNLVELDLKNNFKVIEIKSEKINFLWILKVAKFLNSNHFDLFFSLSNFSFGILYNRTIQVVHDLAPIKFPEFFSSKGRFMYQLQLNLALKRVKAIFTTSETIKNELQEYAPSAKNKIFAGGFGIHDWVFHKSSVEDLTQAKAKYGLPERYFLSVSTLEPRKNYINAVLAFDKFYKQNKDYHFVIVGKKGWYYEKIFETVSKCESKENVHFLGYVPEEDLAPIYDLAKGVIMLSFYEGIGLSGLEATQRGIPVLASDIPIFHEVLENEAIFINPENSDLIAEELEKLKDVSHKDFQLSSQYNWTNSAEKLLKVFEEKSQT